jgi:tetratricopeptide (TPR) repeat protein
MILAGTLGAACDLRGDNEGALRHRRAELELARRHGTRHAVDVAESNVVNVLYRMGRHEEALQINGAVLQRLAGEDGVNLAYAWNTRTALLAEMHLHAELRAHAEAASALFERFEMPYYLERWARVLLVEGRPRAAARLVGRELALLERWGLALPRATRDSVAETRALAVALIGETEWEAWVAQGRALDAAGARALLQPAPAET